MSDRRAVKRRSDGARSARHNHCHTHSDWVGWRGLPSNQPLSRRTQISTGRVRVAGYWEGPTKLGGECDVEPKDEVRAGVHGGLDKVTAEFTTWPLTWENGSGLDKVTAEFTTWPLTWENGSGLVLW
jgi:hypothetical protein